MTRRRAVTLGSAALAAAVPPALGLTAMNPSAALAAGAEAAVPPVPRPPGGVPALRRGVNLSTWLQLDQRQAFGPADFATIAAAGFDHVRVCVDLEVLGWRPRPGPAEVPGIGRVDAALDMARDAGLAAILDCHGNHALSAAVERDAGARAALEALWRALATRYAARSRATLAFEPLNEPQYYDGPAGLWPAFQRRLLAAVREAAPEHLVVLTGRKGGGVEGLRELDPPADPNVVGSFHYYLPYVVTHQGADWGFEGTAVPFLRGVPYPSSRLGASPPRVEPGADPALAEAEIARYAREGWGAGRIGREIEAAARWSRSTGVPVVCPEFGVYRPYADPGSRWRWTADLRAALEARGIGWTVWDYADTFGVVVIDGPSYTTGDGALVPDGPDARRRFDARALAALGLPR